VVAGVFISGLLRCSLREQYLRASAEYGVEEAEGGPEEKREE